MKAKQIWIALNILVIAALACNVPAGGATETPTPATPGTETPTPPPAETATITLTPSPTIPLVSVSTATYCRTGPRTVFDIVFTLDVGIKAELVGKNTALDYWIIRVPGGGSSQCWLWGQYAVTEGNVAGLPEFIPPPTPIPTLTPTHEFTPTPALPLAPSDPTFIAACVSIPFSPDIFTGATLSWTDNADNEDGYRIYYGSGLIDTLGPDAESFSTPPGTGIYGVEAFNSTGASARKSVDVDCP